MTMRHATVLMHVHEYALLGELRLRLLPLRRSLQLPGMTRHLQLRQGGLVTWRLPLWPLPAWGPIQSQLCCGTGQDRLFGWAPTTTTRTPGHTCMHAVELRDALLHGWECVRFEHACSNSSAEFANSDRTTP